MDTDTESDGSMHSYGSNGQSPRSVSPAPGCVGLPNIGNSCFMNSILQILNQVDIFHDFFVSGAWGDDLNESNPLGSGGLVAKAYASFLSDLWAGKYSLLALRTFTLRKSIGAFAPQFKNLDQHDSQEFCNLLMDGIHEDLNRVVDKPYVESLETIGMPDKDAAVASWTKHLQRHDSVIVDHCQGMYRSHVTCPDCGHESVKYDVYSMIPLPLASGKKDGQPASLMDCLDKLARGEQLDQDNEWYCPDCRDHVRALKRIALWSCPDLLTLQIKRFKYRHADGSENGGEEVGGVVRTKVDDLITFPVDNLDLSGRVLGPVDGDAPPVYELLGVSEHTGVAANSGHYTATVRSRADRGRWFRFNDSDVARIAPDASMTGGAYLLFYQRKLGRSRWGGMERAIGGGGGTDAEPAAAEAAEPNPQDASDADEEALRLVPGKEAAARRRVPLGLLFALLLPDLLLLQRPQPPRAGRTRALLRWDIRGDEELPLRPSALSLLGPDFWWEASVHCM